MALKEIDFEWDDADVLPSVFSPDTEFVFRRMTEETLRTVEVPGGNRILDVGCGRAIDAVSLARKGGTLFGCEPSRVMLRKAKEWVTLHGARIFLIRSLAEALPFRAGVFMRVVCKGAIDHFQNPDLAVTEMCRVTSAEGKIVLAVANFESLSCSWGQGLNRFSRFLRGKELSGPQIWKIPPDHTFKFAYGSLMGLVRRHLRIEGLRGVSLFWGFPRWSKVLQKMPPKAISFLLRILDTVAGWFPSGSDVLILTGRPFKNLSAQERRKHMGDTSRFWGAVLCLAILIVAILFLWGISLRSYWALAVPVAVGFLGVLALGFWIGWTILTIRTAPPSPESAPEKSGGIKGDSSTEPKL
jgi:SAM-dependent methyltransferase